MNVKTMALLMLVSCSIGLFAHDLYVFSSSSHYRGGPIIPYETQYASGTNQWVQVGTLARYTPPSDMRNSAKNWVESLRENTNPTYVILSSLASFVGIAGVVNHVLKPMNAPSLIYYSMWAIAGSLGLQASAKNDAPWYKNPSTPPPVLGLLFGAACRFGVLPLPI